MNNSPTLCCTYTAFKDRFREGSPTLCHPFVSLRAGSEPFAVLEDKLREGNTPTPCHPEPFTAFEDRLREGSQRCRCYSNSSVGYALAAFRFFAPLRSAQNDKLGRCTQR